MKKLSLVLFTSLIPEPVVSDEPYSIFSDQAHYELVYEYKYYSNYVERLIFECTADREVWRMFGLASAALSNAYGKYVLHTSIFQNDPFTDQRWVSRLSQEIFLHVFRDYTARGDPADPVLMAQRDVLQLVERYKDELDLICDFLFWERVTYLEEIVNELISDAQSRLNAETFDLFMERAHSNESILGSGLPRLQRLFASNPLQLNSSEIDIELDE